MRRRGDHDFVPTMPMSLTASRALLLINRARKKRTEAGFQYEYSRVLGRLRENAGGILAVVCFAIVDGEQRWQVDLKLQRQTKGAFRGK